MTSVTGSLRRLRRNAKENRRHDDINAGYHLPCHAYTGAGSQSLAKATIKLLNLFNGLPVTLKTISMEQFMKALHILIAVAGMYLPTLAMAQISLETLRTCLDIEDQSKERLDCYDDKIKPAPKKVSAPAKTVQDCRFVKEEDERLNCFNRFVNPPPKKNTVQQKPKQPAAGRKAPGPAKQ